MLQQCHLVAICELQVELLVGGGSGISTEGFDLL